MGCRNNRESSSLAARLAYEYEVLRVIDERRLKEKKPNLGRSLEERIVGRTLDELEA
jgi:hypothetical protein